MESKYQCRSKFNVWSQFSLDGVRRNGVSSKSRARPEGWLVGLCLLMLTATCLQANAEEGDAPVEVAVVVPADDFNRGSPLRSVNGYLDAVDEGDYETAAEYLDLRNLRGEATELTGRSLARRLFVISARATWVDVADLVDDPAGRGNDGLPAYRDLLGTVLHDGKEVQLLMQKVPRGDGVSIWKVSNATVALIPELYETFGYPAYVEKLRRTVPDIVILGYELFKWILVLATAVVSYAVVFLMAVVMRRMLGAPDSPTNRRIYKFMLQPVGIWAAIVSMNYASGSLGRTVTAEAIQKVTPIPIIVTVWLMFTGIDLIRDIYAARLNSLGRAGAAVLLRPLSNALKLLIGLAAALTYLDKLGVNITTVLAGLGVGGVAVALALQKPMEDVFGAITLYTQQPIKVGDFCRVGSITGTVEEIGLRTTRVRTLANTLVAIPNAKLANEPIDNISARSKVLYRPTLRLRYDTTPAQITQVLEGVRELFSSHEKILQDNPRVRFVEIADDALLIEAYAYLDTNEWAAYLELAEGLNLKILEIVALAGTTLSLPAKTLHIEQPNNAVQMLET